MTLANILRLLALGCLVPVFLHVTLGVSGDSLIGAPVPAVIDASLDSQNRFYGASFGIYAALRDLSTAVRVLAVCFQGCLG